VFLSGFHFDTARQRSSRRNELLQYSCRSHLLIDTHYRPTGVSHNRSCDERMRADAVEYRSSPRSHCIVDAMGCQLWQRNWSLILAMESDFHFRSPNTVTVEHRDVCRDIHNVHGNGLSPRNPPERVPEPRPDDDVPVELLSLPSQQTLNQQSKPVGSTCLDTDSSDRDRGTLLPDPVIPSSPKT
jgi:hypothetical protein